MDDGTYEFNDSQNELILDLSKKMTFVSYFLIAGGVLGGIAGIVTLVQGGFAGLVQGIVLLITGVWTINAAKAFKLIVYTEGNDIENLIGALGQLRKLYTLQFWLSIIALIFMAIALIMVLIMAIAINAG